MNTQWEVLFENEVYKSVSVDDPAHDLLHFKRVVATAKKLAVIESAKFDVVIPAAWLHDLVNVPKDSPLRNMASRLSAQKAVQFLESINYPKEFLNDIFHAIEAHSFSANIKAESIEAQIVQDADRLDALGAIGIARCFSVGSLMKREFYSSIDPFCENRKPSDKEFTIDHFYQKLVKLPDSMQTEAGKREGRARLKTMTSFLDSLKVEISGASSES